jgi:hyperosmotically inducible protein
MYRLTRDLTLGLLGFCLVTAVGCSHKEDSGVERSDVSVTDEARSQPATTTASTRTSMDNDRAVAPQKRTEEAAAKNRAAIASNSTSAPTGGSDAEYAADVDAAMGDESAPATARASTVATSASASAAVNSAADNSRVNRLNDGAVGITADQQGNSKSDIEITRKIRKAITDNKKLSTYAHNVKIITREGRVVLKGPVRSEGERQTVEDTAVTVAGAGNVSSGIEIQAK